MQKEKTESEGHLNLHHMLARYCTTVVLYWILGKYICTTALPQQWGEILSGGVITYLANLEIGMARMKVV